MNVVLLIAVLVLAAIVLVLAFLVLGTLRALGVLTWRVEQLETVTPSRIGRDGIKLGKRAPDFSLPIAKPRPVVTVHTGEPRPATANEQTAANGQGFENAETLALHDFAGRKVLLVFTQSGCGPCREIIPELNRVQDNGEHQVLVVNNGGLEQTRQWAADVQARFPVVAQEKFSLSKRYEIFVTPFAFLIDEEGVVVSKGIAGSRQYLNYVLTGAGQKPKHEQDQTEPEAAEKSQSVETASSPSSKEVIHV